MGRARDIANVLSSSTNIALDSELGLSLITPTSIANTGGTSSISATGAVTFTSASAISLNGVFSSTYRNYRAIVNFSGSTAGTLGLRFRTSGTDNTNGTPSGYYWAGGYLYQQGASITSNTSNYNNIGRVSRYDTGAGATTFDIMDPFTSGAATSTFGFSTGGGANWESLMNYYADGAIIFDGFSLIASTGTVTGVIRVYGYRN